MSELFGLLEKEASEEQERTSGTRAVIAAQTRVKERFEKFLASSEDDLEAKLSLIDDEVRKIALDVCNEYTYADSEKVYLAATAVLGGGHAADCSCGFCENKGKLPGASDDDDGDKDEDDSKESSVKVACSGDCEGCDDEHCSAKKESAVSPRFIPEFPWEHVAADTETGDSYSQESVDLPTADASGLADVGSPKIDKSKSGDHTGWDLPDIEVPSNRNQKEEQSAPERADYNSEDFDPSNPVRERVDADSPMQPEFNVAPNTETWTGTESQAAPVTSSVAKWSIVE